MRPTLGRECTPRGHQLESRGQLAELGVEGMVLGENPALHHVGIVVADIDTAISRYIGLGFSGGDRFAMTEQGVIAVTFQSGANYIELIQPTDPDGPIARFKAKRGEGLQRRPLNRLHAPGRRARLADRLHPPGIVRRRVDGVGGSPGRGCRRKELGAGDFSVILHSASSACYPVSLCVLTSPPLMQQAKRKDEGMGDDE